MRILIMLGIVKKGDIMKKLSNKQKTIIVVTCAFVLVLVSVFIVVKTVRNRTQKQEYERVSTESEMLLSDSVPEITSESTSENTSVPTTEEATSQNTTTTKKKASTTQKPEKKAESTTKTGADTNKPIRINLMTYGPIPNPSNTGGYYIVRRDADNFREDPNGGYLFDVWAEIANNKHYDSIPDHPIEGRLAFSVRTFDDEFIVSDVIDVGTLQPGESKKGTVTVHVDEDKGYQVYFYTI